MCKKSAYCGQLIEVSLLFLYTMWIGIIISSFSAIKMDKVILLLCLCPTGIVSMCGPMRVPTLRETAAKVVGEPLSAFHVFETDADGFPATVMATTISKFDK